MFNASDFNGPATFMDEDGAEMVRLGISTNASGTRYLISEVQGRNAAGGLMPMYRMPLALLEPDEFELDQGRFARFDMSFCENRCDLSIQQNGLSYSNVCGYANLYSCMNAMIGWCADQAAAYECSWNFDLKVRHMSCMTLSFYFGSSDLAVLYKLQWT